MIQIIYEFYFKEKTTARSVQELADEIDEYILAEVQSQEEESILRGKRQMQCLLDKRIVELEDIYWEKLMLKLIESSNKEITRLILLYEFLSFHAYMKNWFIILL